MITALINNRAVSLIGLLDNRAVNLIDLEHSTQYVSVLKKKCECTLLMGYVNGFRAVCFHILLAVVRVARQRGKLFSSKSNICLELEIFFFIFFFGSQQPK